MDNLTKQTLAFIINLNSQILKNQINDITINLTHEYFKNSKVLIDDCVEVVNKLSKVVEAKPIKNLEDVNLVFNHWNHPKINLTHHRVIADHSSAINVALKNYTVQEINLAIANFSIVCNNDLYHDYRKRPLKDFLKNYLLKFIESADPLTNFRKKVYGNQKTQSAIISNEKAFDIAEQAIQSRDQGLF